VDVGRGIAADPAGNAYVAGRSGSGNFPVANALQVSLGGNGVSKSTSGGASWAPVDSLRQYQIAAQALAIDPANPAKVYLGNHGSGVFITDNGGDTWRESNAGLTDRRVSGLAIDPSSPLLVYAGGPGGVFKSVDGGENWTESSAGLPGATTVNVLAIDPKAPSTVYAGTSRGVFKSLNGGQEWQAAGLANIGVSAFALAPTVLYAGAYYNGVYRSEDGGVNWQQISAGLPLVTICGAGVVALAVDPTDSLVVFAAGEFYEPECFPVGGVYKSTNGGASWGRSLIATTLTLAMDPSDSSTLYAGTDSGVYKTTTGSAPWQRMSDGLPPSTGVRALAVDPMTPSTVYAGTEGSGGDSFIAKIGPGGAKR